MVSQARQECTDAVTEFSKTINENLEGGNLLYVGIAGDPPGGEYSPLFSPFNIKTFDADPVWGPDIVGDITGCDLEDESQDVIICVQVLEHVPNLWDVPKEMYRLLKTGGYAIVDCPWMYPYHAEPPSFGDFWRISKDGLRVLFDNFEIVSIIEGEQNTSCLIRKNKTHG
jgi:SAM-dependent methyltransferase